MQAEALDTRPTSSLVLEAIALRRCIAAIYNRMAVRLAPHILYTKHDELYVDAITLERDGRPPRELKLGTFKLSGLHDLAADPAGFRPEALFDARDRKYEGVTLFAVEAD